MLINEPLIAKVKSHKMVDIKSIFFKKKALHISHFLQRATSTIPFRVVGKKPLQSAFTHIFLLWSFCAKVRGHFPSFSKWRCPHRLGDLLKVTQLPAAQLCSLLFLCIFTAPPYLLFKTRWKTMYYPWHYCVARLYLASLCTRHPLKCDFELGRELLIHTSEA